MISVHAIFENGKVEFVFDAPQFSGPVAVLVIFPEVEEGQDELEISGDSPWCELDELF